MRTASPRQTALWLTALLCLALAGCSSPSGKAKRVVKTGSVSVSTVGLMRNHDMERAAPILMRVFKEEAVLEIWKQDRTGRFGLLRSYPICKFSGKLGPKRKEGDRQAPEGFYTISPKSLNPFSRNHLAFNIGFPNAFDRSLGRTGTHLMVHGGCNSIGCYAMTHKHIEEIYGLAREAMMAGQDTILFQAFPFRMTEEKLARHADNPNAQFWRDLKPGHDIFTQTGEPPRVFACDGRYAFAPAGTEGDVCAMAQAYAPASERPLAGFDQIPY